MKLKVGVNRHNMLKMLNAEGFLVDKHGFYERTKRQGKAKFSIQLFGNQYALRVHIKSKTESWSRGIHRVATTKRLILNIKQAT